MSRIKDLFEFGERELIHITGVTGTRKQVTKNILANSVNKSSLFFVESFTLDGATGAGTPIFYLDGNPLIYNNLVAHRTEYGFLCDKVLLQGSAASQNIGIYLVGYYVNKSRITKI